MKHIEIDDLESFTLRETIATYGQEILQLWKNAVYTKPYKLEKITLHRRFTKPFWIAQSTR